MNEQTNREFTNGNWAMAEAGVAKTHEMYENIGASATSQGRVTEEALRATRAGAKEISAKLINNATTNTEAVFAAAFAMAGARSFPDLARLQADFMQKQLAIAGEQSKELFDLSSRVAQQTMETINLAATKAFDHAKKGI